MSIFSKKEKPNTLKKEIASVLDKMSSLKKDSTEYAKMADQLKILCELSDKQKDKGISWDTIAIVAGNLLGILIIVGYERANVLTSKALGFILRGRV